MCSLRNAIGPKTWKKINELLTKDAVQNGLISGERLRIDTTAYETNIRWPTDSGLLWDTYRVLARVVESARKIDPEAASDRRLQTKKVKRIHTSIARRSGKKGTVSKEAKSLYTQLFRLVEVILECRDQRIFRPGAGPVRSRRRCRGLSLAAGLGRAGGGRLLRQGRAQFAVQLVEVGRKNADRLHNRRQVCSQVILAGLRLQACFRAPFCHCAQIRSSARALGGSLLVPGPAPR